VVLRRKLTVLLMTVVMLVTSAAPALATHEVGHSNNGNKGNDGADANQGGGQEKSKKPKKNRGGIV
jgi:hypothetical protein